MEMIILIKLKFSVYLHADLNSEYPVTKPARIQRLAAIWQQQRTPWP
jgi:hypothetical protein